LKKSPKRRKRQNNRLEVELEVELPAAHAGWEVPVLIREGQTQLNDLQQVDIDTQGVELKIACTKKEKEKRKRKKRKKKRNSSKTLQVFPKNEEGRPPPPPKAPFKNNPKITNLLKFPIGLATTPGNSVS